MFSSTDRPKTIDELRASKKETCHDQVLESVQKQHIMTNQRKRLTKKEKDELIGSLGSPRSAQMTPFGLAFYTGECVLSNHFKTEFNFNGRPQTSSEQAYFAEMAICAKDPEALKDIMSTDSPSAAKHRGEKIVVPAVWKHLKRPRMRAILYAKFSQSALLKKKLLATRGLRLIEASFNDEWGYGAKLHSASLINRRWHGNNFLGEELEDVREDLHRSDQCTRPAVHSIRL